MDFDDFGTSSNKSASISASISPLCHRLCSEKVKDRQEAVVQLKNLLSDGQRMITESMSILMINALKRYVTLEGKGTTAAAQGALGKALRDWRWGVGLVTGKYPAIFVAEMSNEVVAFMGELCNAHPTNQAVVVHEGLLVLGRHVLNKPAYLHKLKESSIEKLILLATQLNNNQTEINDLLKVLALVLKALCTRSFRSNLVEQVLRMIRMLLERNNKQSGSDYAASSEVFTSLIVAKDYSLGYSEAIDIDGFYELAPKYALGIRNLNCFAEIVTLCRNPVIVETDLWRQLVEREIAKPRLNVLAVEDFGGAVRDLMLIGVKVYTRDEILMNAKGNKYYAVMAYLHKEIRVQPALLQGITNSEVLAWWMKKLSEVDVEELFEEWDLDYFYSLLFKKGVWPLGCQILERMMECGHFGLFARFYEKFQAFASVNDSAESLTIVGLLSVYVKGQRRWRSWDVKMEEECAFIMQWVSSVLTEHANNAKVFKYLSREVAEDFVDIGALPSASLISDALEVVRTGKCDNVESIFELVDPMPLLELFPMDSIAFEAAVQFHVRWYKHLAAEKQAASGHASNTPSSSLEEEFAQPPSHIYRSPSTLIYAQLKVLHLISSLSVKCGDVQFGGDARLFVEKSVGGILMQDAAHVRTVVKLFDIRTSGYLEGVVMERLHYLLNERVRAFDPANLVTVLDALCGLLRQGAAWVFEREQLVLMLQFLINKAISRKYVVPAELYLVLVEKAGVLLEAEMMQLYLSCNYLVNKPKWVPGLLESLDIKHVCRYMLVMPVKECVKALLNMPRRIPHLDVFDARDVRELCTQLCINESQLLALFGLGVEVGWWPGKLKSNLDVQNDDPRAQALSVLEKKSRPRTFSKELIAALLLNTLDYGGEVVFGVLKGKSVSTDGLGVLVEMLDESRTPLMDDCLTCALVVYERVYGSVCEVGRMLLQYVQSKYHGKSTVSLLEWDYRQARIFAIDPQRYNRVELERIYERLYGNGCSKRLLSSELRGEIQRYDCRGTPSFKSVREAYLYELALRVIASGTFSELKSYLMNGEGLKRGTFEEAFPGVPVQFIQEQLGRGTIDGNSVLQQMNPLQIVRPICPELTQALISAFFKTPLQPTNESLMERMFDWAWITLEERKSEGMLLFVVEGVHAMSGRMVGTEGEGMYDLYRRIYGDELSADPPHFKNDDKYKSDDVAGRSMEGARKYIAEGLGITSQTFIASDYDVSLYAWLKNNCSVKASDGFLFGGRSMSTREKIGICMMRRELWECVLGNRPVEETIREAERALGECPEVLELLGMASQKVPVLRPLCGLHLAEVVLEREGKPEKAMQILRSSLVPSGGVVDLPLQVRMLLKMSRWSLKYRNEPHTIVQRNYLEAALKLTEGNQKLRVQCAHELGVFLEGRYRTLSEPTVLVGKGEQIRKYQEQHVALRMNMEALGQRVQMLRKSNSGGTVLGEEEAKLNELYRTVTLLGSEIKIDVQELQRITEERQACYLRTVGLYAEVLMFSDGYDMDVYRLVSLWFEEGESALGAELLTGRGFEKGLGAIGSHKFVPLMTQILAKAEQLSFESCASSVSVASKRPKVMGGSTEKENLGAYVELQVRVMKKLVARLCGKHPYHCLWPLICMSNQANDVSNDVNNNVGGISVELLRMIMGTGLGASEVAKGMLQGARLYSELAGAPVPCDAYNRPLQKTFKYEAKWAGQTIPSTIPACPVPTANIRVEPDGRYESVPLIRSLGTGYSVIGGLSMPKIIECTGSDGRTYKQLVKGKDDVRQDAMVEQLFLTVNRILESETSKLLRVRTFRVVPLHATAGILEWVADTVPIGDYLVPAHERWRPQDWTSKSIRSKLHKLMGNGEEVPVEERIRVGREVFANIQPVMRYFFFEHFASDGANSDGANSNGAHSDGCNSDGANSGGYNWLQARSEFSKSVAVSSMLGYLVGLGDRHVQNILLDCKTGEVVHIDLNMIFEGGRNLKIPERVPFRLTRDIVDGMGPWGTSQGFRRHAAETLKALRHNSSMLLTVIGVVVVQKVRERALTRTRERLSGVVEGGGEGVSEMAQVLALEREAVSVENLSLMYHGWSFWL